MRAFRAAVLAALTLFVGAHALSAAAKRPITIDDVMSLVHIDTLSVSPDEKRFAIFVRRADADANEYRAAWLVGQLEAGPLTFVGRGGESHPAIGDSGHMTGDFAGPECRWSPDGQWIAYPLERGGEVQLWRSRIDGRLQEQLTHSAADVRAFAWREDGHAIYFTIGGSHERLRAEEGERDRSGYRYDEDLHGFTDFMLPRIPRAITTASDVRVFMLGDRSERRATQTELNAFERARQVGQDSSAGEIPHPPGDILQQCSRVKSHWICLRETPALPAHVAAIDARSGAAQILGDVNPRFHDIEVGRAERFEWETPRLAWNEPGGKLAGLYPERAHGYILYPRDFDSGRQYPAFIEPYIADGFHSKYASEHALYVYASSGIVVLNMAFPVAVDAFARLGASTVKQLYSAELDFPHLTMLMESTVRGLDTALGRGFIDRHRVGIGGVSHGTFVPLYMLQKYDRIAAISISSPTWGPHEYYWATRKGREAAAQAYVDVGYEEWRPKPEGAGREFWSRFDIADHVEAIEAPIMMNLAAAETYALLRLIRHMDDAGKPYDAYVFPRETHIKWQPAHLRAIYRRNLDWFRFWLQGYEDPAPDKAAQNARWRKLRPRLDAPQMPSR